MSNYTGRGNGASPASDFFPLSGASASSPGIAITATIVGSANTLHTADAFAIDVPIIYVANNSAGTLVAYMQLGTTATTSAIPTSIGAGSWSIVNPGLPISKSGVVSMWTTASTGLQAFGGVNRTYTATA